MDFLFTILWPIRWIVELLLVAFHWVFTSVGLDGNDGLTWVLAIMCMVIVIRTALIPVFVKQIMSQRKMLEIGPDIKKIQDKYKGKKDQFSREAMVRETQAIYKKHGTSPYASCLPMLVQMPIFFGLYSVLSLASQSGAGIGLMTQELASAFGAAKFFGAPIYLPLSEAFGQGGPMESFILAPVMILLMMATQFYTQRQVMMKNMSEEAKASPAFKTQKMMMYFIPFILLFTGFAFPPGVMFYWFTNNLWTMVQQFIVIRNMPTPGSPAFKAMQERKAKKAARKGIVPEVTEAEAIETEAKTQRVQPVGKARAKKKGKK